MGRERDDEEKTGRSGPRPANDQAPPGAVTPAAFAPDGGVPAEEGAPVPEGATPPPPDPMAEAQARVESLEKANAELKDRMLRVAADFDNYKKRIRKEIAEAEPKGREALAKELLPALDNLDRALAHATASDPAASGAGLVEGVKMVQRQFLLALEKFDIKPFSALGEAFDPQFHAAVAQVPSDKPAGMVVEEFQKGYKMGSRLIRPAMVAVATPPRAPVGGGDGEGDGGGKGPPDAE
jgi:molecular chaperone GrpE